MGSIDKSTRNAENIGGPVTPSPIRYSGQIRSASKFSSLDEDEEEEGRERDRELWSAELVDMEIDLGHKDLEDVDQDIEIGSRSMREPSEVTVVLDTPLKSVQESSPKSSEFELKEEEEESGKLFLSAVDNSADV